MQFIKLLATVAMGAAVLLTTGCAQLTMGAPKQTLENTQRLRGMTMAPVNLGSFVLDSRLDASADKSVTVRGGNKLSAPGGSFAGYLKDTLAVELRAAGLLDANSHIEISGVLTESKLDPATGVGSGSLKARIVVTRDGAKRYDRELSVAEQWESSFMGIEAIPVASGHYEGFYRQLVGKLLDDADFKAVVAK